jgi:hypothetical protein
MNTNFVFPRPQSGVSRPRPARAAKWSSPSAPSNLASSRNSNALRASILHTALELGIGTNSVVTDWMFSNPLMEEPEDAVSPFVIFIQVLFRVNYSRALQMWPSCTLLSVSTQDGLSQISHPVEPEGREAERSPFSVLRVLHGANRSRGQQPAKI